MCMEVFMAKNHNKCKLVHFYQEAFEELYIIDTLVRMTKKSCEDHEFSGEYYGISKNMAVKLSEERNSYINMLTLLSEKVSNLKKIKLCMEKELTLQQNSDNCC